MTSRRVPLRAVAFAGLVLYAAVALAAWAGWGADWRRGAETRESVAPGPEAWLGTDQLGRDIAAMTIQGAWTAFRIGSLAAGAAVLAGALAGLLSGWRAGWPDRLCLGLSAAVSAIPGVLLVVVIAAAMGPGLPALVVAVAAVSWVGVYRVIRAEARRLRDAEYIEAARALGVPARQILWRHLAPACLPLLRIQFGLAFVAAIQAEAVLSFLGLGAPDLASWGRMIAEAWTWDDLGQGRWWRLGSATLALAGLAACVLAISRSDGSRRS